MAIKKKNEDEGYIIVEEPKVEEKKIGGYVAACDVNFRIGPSKNEKVICVIPQGAQVNVVEFEGEWAKAIYNKTNGYVMSEFIKAM